jgi:nucleolysin TIA-1/TIAR
MMNSAGGQALAGTPGVPSPPLFDTSNCRSLYVGNMSTKMTEALLYEIFSTVGAVETCKLIKDKNSGQSTGYGFVDYYDHATAAQAIAGLNGKAIYGSEIKVNWAFAGGHREDTSNHFHIFVGDLSPEIDDRALFNAFSAFGSISDARVMWDQNTGRSRGYGFVAFRKKEDAERGLTEMNGEWLGSRAIRCNWANQKLTPTTPTAPIDPVTVDVNVSPTNTTVYVGNLTPDVNDQMLRSVFSEFGAIEEIRMQKDKGFAFVRFQTHDSAKNAITSMHGKIIGIRAVKCSWGKERTGQQTSTSPASARPSASPPFAYPGVGVPYTYPAVAAPYGAAYGAPMAAAPYMAAYAPYQQPMAPGPMYYNTPNPAMNMGAPPQQGYDNYNYNSY